LHHALEAISPRPEHFLGVVESFGRIAAQGLGEEGGELIPDAGVEDFGINGRFAIQKGRIALAVAPFWRIAGGQFIERDRRCVSLRMEVPPRRLPQR